MKFILIILSYFFAFNINAQTNSTRIDISKRLERCVDVMGDPVVNCFITTDANGEQVYIDSATMAGISDKSVWYESGSVAANNISDEIYHTGDVHIGDATMSGSGKLNISGSLQSSGNIGIGGVAPSTSRGVYYWSGNVSDVSATEYAGTWNLITPTNSSASSASFRGIKADVNSLASGDINTSAKQITGVFSDVRDSGTGAGTTGELSGFVTTAYSNTSRTVNNLFGLYARVGLASSGNIGNMYGTYISMFESGAGTATNAYGLYIENTTGLASGNNYSLYLVGGDSYLNGLVKTQNTEPITDDTYYIGKNDDDTPKAYKGIILKDQTTGTYYRIEINSGAISIVDLTD